MLARRRRASRSTATAATSSSRPRRLDRVLEHEPGDLTAIVEAGLRLSELRRRLEPHGQMLALDPPGDPTIGACLAGDLSGPRRHRYGAMRDLVLGVTVVLADGTIASSGGKVVKNVAGYDLGKLFSGSRGRLGLVARARAAAPPAARRRGDRRRRDRRPARALARAAALAARRRRRSTSCRRAAFAILFEGGAAAVERAGRRVPRASDPRTGPSGTRRRARQLAATGRAPFDWQDCRLARPGPGIAFVDGPPRAVVAARRARARGVRPRGRARVRSGLHWPAVRRTLLCSLVALLALAGAAATGRAATAPQLAASMLPDAPDFPKGATLVSEGPARDPKFPKFPASSTYTRSLRNVKLGPALLLTLQGSAAVAKKVSDPASFMSSLLFVTRSKVGRAALLAQAKNGFGASSTITSVSIVRARDLGLAGGDEGVEFVFRMHTKGDSFEVGEEWVAGPERARVPRLRGDEPGPDRGPEPRARAEDGDADARRARAGAGQHRAARRVGHAAGRRAPHGDERDVDRDGADVRVPVAPLRAATGLCSPIAGAAAATYTATAADQGSTLVASVTATSAAGSASAKSQPTTAVA